MNVSKTINPLHFEDLEPHRFEDLVRQLFYDFKDWKSIEATGRMGADDGVDIQAVESISVEYSDDENNAYNENRFEERTWIIQCKREHVLTPKKVKSIVKNDIRQQAVVPYGYILASSANFSKKSRDAFKLDLNELGVKEFYMFGKAELEDLLFLPKYDHLLFAYFGISLQKRMRTEKSNLTARQTTKRKLVKELGDFENVEGKTIFVKPSQSLGYPYIKNGATLLWRPYEVLCYRPVNCISVVAKKHFAYLNVDTMEWDFIEDCDCGVPESLEIFNMPVELEDTLIAKYNNALGMWNEIEDVYKAYYVIIGQIHFDRILLIDELGDAYHKIGSYSDDKTPHLVVEYINESPFNNENRSFLSLDYSISFENKYMDPDKNKRINIFNHNI